MDVPRHIEKWRAAKTAGKVLPPVEETEDWRPDRLPGKVAFDTAYRALRSNAEVVVDDFMKMDVAKLGTFDVTLFLGVLYHMKDPLESLSRLARVTNTVAVIETHAVAIPMYEHLELAEFYSANQLNADSTNWWGMNRKAIVGMCRAAGFARAEVISPVENRSALRRALSTARTVVSRKPRYMRAVVHAWK